VDNVDVYIVHDAVVMKYVSVPISAFIAVAHVTESVIDAAIETDMGCPIAAIPAIMLIGVSPIWRGPKRADIRRQNPRSGDPIIALGCVTPIARRPNVVLAGTWRLGVFRYGRRGLLSINGLFAICGVVCPNIVVLIVILVRWSRLWLRSIGLLDRRLLRRRLRGESGRLLCRNGGAGGRQIHLRGV
jgi:hypothetical protein